MAVPSGSGAIVPTPLVATGALLHPVYAYPAPFKYPNHRTNLQSTVHDYEKETDHVTETTYTYPAILKARLHRLLQARKAARMRRIFEKK
ncbi:unnamed protein product [Strongylus vulgaris]|uniref:Uncharacterized protein n=1 Tax=Strongylus vulgaris TaxID=40348 RepID=A0A3P7JNI1_STRVU|nr:unnamed protein product [Strongylus vulgaris]